MRSFQPASGRYILKAIDRDLGNPDAVRRINRGLNITRRADDAWQLPSNLVVDGRWRRKPCAALSN